MQIEVLIAAMNQHDCSLLDKMNIQSDAIVGNQCDHNSIKKLDYKGHKVTFLNFNEKGVGLNRNNALMRTTGDICLFADDDMRYVDGYPEMITAAFERNPKADVIVFNITGRKMIEKPFRVNYFNYLKFGTARIAIKTESVRRQGIYFNQCFGGGTEHCHGEDNLFLTACLKNGLKVYGEPILLAELLDNRVSTWNDGNVEKYLVDQGILYKTISRKMWRLLCLQDAIRRRKTYQISWRRAYRMMKNGK